MKNKRNSKKAKRVAIKKKSSTWSKAAKMFSRMFSGWNEKPVRPAMTKTAKTKSRKKVSFRLNTKTKRRKKTALTLKSA